MPRGSRSRPGSELRATPDLARHLLLVALLLLAFGLLVHPTGDPDVYIHLRDGQYWVEHGMKVGLEPFAYTVPDKSMEKVEWLFRVGIYSAWRLGGFNLLILVKAVATTGVLFLLGWIMHRRWPNLGVLALLLGMTMLAYGQQLFPERPFVVTYLFLAFSLLLLDDFRRAGPREALTARHAWQRLWWIPGLTLLWTNLHPGFMLVLPFLGSLWLERLVRYLWKRDPQEGQQVLQLSAIALALLLAGAANPIGFEIYPFVLNALQTNDFMKYILEWAPPTPVQQPFFFALLGLAWLAQLLAYRRTRISDLLPLIFFSYMGLKSYRNIPLFCIAALPPLSEHLRVLWEEGFAQWKWPEKLWREVRITGAVVAVLFLIMASALGFAFRFGEIKAFYPKAALSWMEQQGVTGHLLTHDIWGGYTGWVTHGRVQVFMDGRLPTFGPKLYADYRKMVWGEPEACLHLLDRYQIEAILLSPKNELRCYQQLWRSGQWTLVYWDDVAQLYLRRQGVNQGLVPRFEYRAVDPKHVPYYNPADLKGALTECRRAAEQSPGSFLPNFMLGELQMQTADYAGARSSFERSEALFPEHTGTQYNLGMLAVQTRNWPEAEKRFRRVLGVMRSGEMYGRTCHLLAVALSQQPGREHEAREWVRRALAALPDWKPAQELGRALDQRMGVRP